VSRHKKDPLKGKVFTKEDQGNLAARVCEDKLATFIEHAWPYMDSSPFTMGWPIEAVAEHLEAVTKGHIKRLIINIPPRMGKSSITSVAFPAWTWAQRHKSPTSGPGVRFLFASYAHNLALRDSNNTRRLIRSPWYQKNFGDRFKLLPDQNSKTRFDNDMGGSRLATSVGSALTGEGGNIIVVDDPNNAKEAFSEAIIQGTIDWWDQALSTRLNDMKNGAYVVIQQRLSENDITGHVLSKDHGDWTHLCLPMRYEWRRHCSTWTGFDEKGNDKWFDDPRGKDVDGTVLVEVDENGARLAIDPEAEEILETQLEGTLLWPERFGEKEVRQLERDMGMWTAAGQLQQRPEPKGGGVIKREWWQPWETANYPDMDMVIASLDTAYTEKSANDYSALTVWGVFSGQAARQAERYVKRDGRVESNVEAEDKFNSALAVKLKLDMAAQYEAFPRVFLMYAWQVRMELHELVHKVASTCRQFKVDRLLIENKAAGYSVSQEMRRMFGHEDWGVQLVDPKGQDKLARLYSISHLFEEGLVHAPDYKWAEDVITQVSQFPKGKHDDLVDTVSMGIKHLRDIGVLVRQPEWAAELDEGRKHVGKAPAPLYPV